MSRTVSALYDTKADAEAACERLTSEFDVEGRAKIIDKSSMSGGSGSSELHGVLLSDEDREVYGEGLRRGGFMLCAEVDEDEEADRIIAVLKQTSSVDLAERQNNWRNDGWSGSANTEESQRSGTSFAERSNVLADGQDSDTTGRR